MNAYAREIYVSEKLISSLSESQSRTLQKLRDIFRYNVQFEIK